MKQTKTIESYRCDFCGKECEHTEYVLPTISQNVVKEGNIATFYNDIEPVQCDLCEACQKKVHFGIQLSRMAILNDDGELELNKDLY
ncbi:MAG: hypothetical protein PHD56_07835 [Anaerostipes sp.]|nr:hypothetical protein [Anaerostipes sp.]